MSAFLSYLRSPFLASSAIAAVGSGLLYVKQKYVRRNVNGPYIDPDIASSSIPATFHQVQGQMKVYQGLHSSVYPIMKIYGYPPLMENS